jgi:histone H3/H4
MGDLYVVQSKVKAFIRKKGCNTSADAVKMLSKTIEEHLVKAVTRAKANRRKTVKPSDL